VSAPAIAADRDKDRARWPGIEPQIVDGGIGLEPIGRRIEVQRGAPHFAVQPARYRPAARDRRR